MFFGCFITCTFCSFAVRLSSGLYPSLPNFPFCNVSLRLHQTPHPPPALAPHLWLNCCLCLALDDNPLISYSPWTKVELCAIIKAFSNPKDDSIGFAGEFLLTIQTYELRFSDLCQFAHMLAGQRNDRQGLNTVWWQNSVRDSSHRRGEAVHDTSKLARWCHEKVPQAFPQVLDWKKIQK